MRDINQLTTDVKFLANRLVAECAKAGLKIKITDCLRTEAEQNAISSANTKVRYPNSYHNLGLAFDFCRNDGKGAYNDTDGFFTKVGAIGKLLGLKWGGDWNSFKDRPHFEYHGYGTREQILARYKTPDAFLKVFGINPYAKPKGTIKPTSNAEAIKFVQAQLNIRVLPNAVALVVDGKYGAKTKEVVASWYRLNGWKANPKGTYMGPIALARLCK